MCKQTGTYFELSGHEYANELAAVQYVHHNSGNEHPIL